MAELTLFGQQDAISSFQHYIEELKNEINSKSNDYILNVDIDKWRNYFINKYDFLPLTIYPEKVVVDFKSKGKREFRGFEVDTYNFELKVPYTGWSFLFMLKPTTCLMSHPRVSVPQSDNGYITARIVLTDHDENKFEYEKKRIIDAIIGNAPNINKDLESFKIQVIQTFDTIYSQKREKVLSENSFFEKLNINIESSTDKIFKVPILEKKIIPEPLVDKKTKKQYSDSPTLDDKLYDDIIEVIYTFFKSVEKKPSTYNKKDEEGLRDYVLPTLETRYSNSTVTGETFNKGGKTDILIRYKDGTNLFVAECKFWKGDVILHETINQLFDRYLTWRDSKVAIIFFVKNKEFSKVLQTIRDSVKNHPYYIRENGSHGESSLSYIFHFPTDNGKIIFTEIMAFHFPE